MHTLKLAAATLMGFAVMLSTGCNPQPKHPNQINAFDGASYDSLTLAHAALSSLRTTVSTTYPQYTTAFNQAAASYAMAYGAYGVFRTNPADQAQAALTISDLTVSIVSLENTLQAGIHVSPQTVIKMRGKAARVRAAAAPRISISDILTELEIAASIAATVPGTQPYATLAEIVIKSTRTALAAFQASAGQPIDLSIIQPITPIQ
jgi:hypothetical protein